MNRTLSLVKLEDRLTPVVFFNPPHFIGRLHYNPQSHQILFMLGDVSRGERHRVEKYHLTYTSNFLREEALSFAKLDVVVTLTGNVMGHTISVSDIQVGY